MKRISRLKRVGDVIVVFVKYGLSSFFPTALLRKSGADSVRSREDIERYSVPERFRMAFEELGTTFIKLGQVLSHRVDLLPAEYVSEFKKLQDSVEPIPYDAMLPVIEKELGQGIDEVFSYFNPVPLAAASISQVYEATLKNSGKDVVVKVRKPGVVQTINSDMELLLTLANLLNRYSSYRERIDFRAVVEEFFITTKNELNLLVEMRNTNRFRKSFSGDEWFWVYFPEMIGEYCSSALLVMERINGWSLYELAENDQSVDRQLLADRGARLLMKMILKDGFFHADLHAGNIFFHAESRFSVIDCGMVGELDQYTKEQIASFFVAFSAGDYRSLAKVCLNIAEVPEGGVDRRALARDIQRIVSVLPRSLADVNIRKVMADVLLILHRYRLRVPSELTSMFRAMSTVEGLCLDLDPEFHIFEVSKQLSEELLAEKFSPQNISRELFALFSRLSELASTAPENIADILDKVEQGQLYHPVRFSLDKRNQRIVSRFVSRLSGSLILTAAIISVAIVNIHEPIRVAVIVGGVFLGLALLLLSFKEG